MAKIEVNGVELTAIPQEKIKLVEVMGALHISTEGLTRNEITTANVINCALAFCAHMQHHAKAHTHDGKVVVGFSLQTNSIRRHLKCSVGESSMKRYIRKLKDMGVITEDTFRETLGDNYTQNTWSICMKAADKLVKTATGMSVYDFDFKAIVQGEIEDALEKSKKPKHKKMLARMRKEEMSQLLRGQEELNACAQELNELIEGYNAVDMMACKKKRSPNACATSQRVLRDDKLYDLFGIRGFNKFDINASIIRFGHYLKNNVEYDEDMILNSRNKSCNGKVKERIRLFDTNDDTYIEIAKIAGYKLPKKARKAYKNVVVSLFMSAHKNIYKVNEYEWGKEINKDFDLLVKVLKEPMKVIMKKTTNALHEYCGWSVKFGAHIFIVESLVMNYVNLILLKEELASATSYDAIHAPVRDTKEFRQHLDDLANEAFEIFVRDMNRSFVRTRMNREKLWKKYEV